MINPKNLEDLSKKGISIVEIKAVLGQLPKCLATTAAGAKRAHQIATSSEDLLTTLLKWRELSFIEADSAKSAAQAKKALDDALPGSEGERLAFTKSDDFSLILIDTANSISEIKKVLINAPLKGKAIKAGISKMVSLSNDVDELVEIYKETMINSDERLIVVRKIIQLSLI